MKVILATGIFPPDIGGPAIYTEKLAKEFCDRKIVTQVICYSGINNKEYKKYDFPVARISRKYPKGIRHFLYFWKLLKIAKNVDIIYAQNAVSTGLPGLLVAKILRKKIVLRFGGDLLWERAMENNQTNLALKEYYQNDTFKQKLFLYKLSNFVFQNADFIVFPTIFLRNLYLDYYHIVKEKTAIIDYPFPKIQASAPKEIFEPRQILFAGRLVRFKNLFRLIDAFSKIQNKNVVLKIIGNGPEEKNLKQKVKDLKLQNRIIFEKSLPQSELAEEIKKSYFAIIPSIFEPGSFFAFECIKLKTPILFTKEAGLYDFFKDILVFFDPFDTEDIKNKIDFLLIEKNWQKNYQKICQIDTSRNWRDVASDNIKIFQKLLLPQSRIITRKVLFIGPTYYNFSEPKILSHLAFKFFGLSKEIKIFVLARGKFFHQKKWKSDFYLLPKFFLFWPVAFLLSFYLCLFKKIDTVVCQSPLAEGFIGVFLKKILRKELIVEAHGDWVEGTFLSRKRKFEFLERKIIPYLARFSLKNADKIRVVSQATKAQAQKISKSKHYFVFPAFTNLDIFLREQDIKFNNFILFVGHLEKVKGIEYLIDAFNKTKDEFPDFKLVLIGKGGERKKYQLSIINYQLQNKVEFRGELPLEQVRDIMKNCYCLVLPSLSEGLPRVLMEAMALGKPVIGSNVGGIPDLIKDNYNGFLIEPKNSNDLYEKVKILLKDKNLTIQMGKRGRKIIEQNFSNEKYVQNFINMINYQTN